MALVNLVVVVILVVVLSTATNQRVKSNWYSGVSTKRHPVPEGLTHHRIKAREHKLGSTPETIVLLTLLDPNQIPRSCRGPTNACFWA